MKQLSLIARVMLGLLFFVFGLNGFFVFISPPPLAPAADTLMHALISSGYLLYFAKLTEVVGGALLLSGYYVPFALVLLAPVLVNIVLFHLFLDPANLAVPLAALLLWGFLVFRHRAQYRTLFAPK